LFEGWKDLPVDIHMQLADWEVGNYTASIRESLEAIRDGRPAATDEADYSYLLLAEAEAVIEAEPHVYLWPCDCRAIVGRCRKPSNVCLRFDNDRGLGWEISKERALEILRAADRAGLLHTDYVGRSAGDLHAICNCCTDCCFPHLAAERLGVTDVWPRRRYVAHITSDSCVVCGRCALRCPFGAMTCPPGGRPRLDPAACRGCGLCATECGSGVIEMRPLPATPAT
jgi:Pyruvate/2-oxoacid:ferredoxin oxidoreductase delta subunit